MLGLDRLKKFVAAETARESTLHAKSCRRPFCAGGRFRHVLGPLFRACEAFHLARRATPQTVSVATAIKSNPAPRTSQELYLDLLKKVLTRAQIVDRYERYTITPNIFNRLTLRTVEPLLHKRGFDLVGLRASNPEAYMKAGYADVGRADGGETMVGLIQLDNVQYCVVDALRHNVPGDLMEAGAWRGGVTIFMRGILKAYSDADRKVWVADSFEGLPTVDASRGRRPLL